MEREIWTRGGEAWPELLAMKNAERSVRKEVEDDEDKWVCFPRVIPPFEAFQIFLFFSFQKGHFPIGPQFKGEKPQIAHIFVSGFHK